MNFQKIKRYVIALIIVLSFDLVWIFLIAQSFYTQQLSGFARPEIVPVWSALLAWALIPLGIVFFVDQIATNYKESLFYGALFGFILYGVYDFTNYATLANYTLAMLLVDLVWGTILVGTSSFLVKVVGKKWLR